VRLRDLAGRRVGIWGDGIEGRSASARIEPIAADVVVVTDDGRHAPPSALADCDVVVKSAGVSAYRPELAGLTVTNTMALFLAEARAIEIPVLAVTGTKGKSTTTVLTSLLAESAGLRTSVGGNIGVDVLTLLDDEPPDLHVVEVSSYQATNVDIPPTLGALTNLSPDHIPWHGSVERYYADKLNLFRNREFVDGRAITIRREFRTPHDTRNLAVASELVGRWLGRTLTDDEVDAGCERFTPLPGRLEVVREHDDVTWVTDTLASNPAGVCAALDAYADRPRVVILGGADRDVDFSELVARLHGTRVVAFCATAPRLARLLTAAHVDHVVVDSDEVADAVEAARAWARRGDVVLFSPGAPTPARQGTWDDRRSAFRAAVAVA
jgi:UDP-N-acetylmuramoyl-L-alanine---L-glutamate ligase